MIRFTKPALSIEDQIRNLRERGLAIGDDSYAEHCLRHYNYYRLGAYWLPFEADHSSHRFVEGASFERVVELYDFDRELRLLVLDAIERVEVSVRSSWAHQVGLKHGAHAHLERNLFVDVDEWQKQVDQLKGEVGRSKEVFVSHFRKNYEEELPPIWAVCELMSMGALSKWYRNFGPKRTKKRIADVYGLDQGVLGSWLHHLSIVRNICAHHGRLWNRELTFRPMLPRTKSNKMRLDYRADHLGIYNTLVILDYLLSQISPGYDWWQHLEDLIVRYGVRREQMGFPDPGATSLA